MPSILQWKSGHIKGEASLRKDNLVVFYYLKSGHIKGEASLRKDNLVVFYYLSAYRIWLDKRCIWREGLYKRGTTV